MNWSLINFYLFLIASISSIQEIQIEGKNGWAKNLPAWKPDPTKWYAVLIDKLFGNDLLGYHLFTLLLMLLYFHLPYLFGFEFTLEHELEIIALYFLFGPVRDYLWFVFNPYYGYKSFKKGVVPWHKKWVLGLPKQYWVRFGLSLVVVFWLVTLMQSYDPLIWWLRQGAQFLLEILILVLVYKLFGLENHYKHA